MEEAPPKQDHISYPQTASGMHFHRGAPEEFPQSVPLVLPTHALALVGQGLLDGKIVKAAYEAK